MVYNTYICIDEGESEQLSGTEKARDVRLRKWKEASKKERACGVLAIGGLHFLTKGLNLLRLCVFCGVPV